VEGDVFYDLGSGVGGPTLLAALGTRARCRGVEVHAAYVDRARTTARALGLRDHVFVVADALEHDWSDGNRFYLFNPFPAHVLRLVGERLRQIGRRREVRIACFHTRLGDGFAATAVRGAVTVYRTTGH
jgi:Histone methylation protein DOT1